MAAAKSGSAAENIDLGELIAGHKEDMIAFRRDLHENPELSWQEFRTTERIKQALDAQGIPYLCPADTGCIAVIQGRPGGKVIGLRGDIDALPVQEQNETPYRSQKDGVMHACGHDGHTAALLTAAKVLHQLRDQFTGTVKLIFQPSEEYLPCGALAMMAKNDLEDCAAIMGLHLRAHIPLGKFSVEEGPRMAASAGVDIHVKGKGGHGGNPHEAVDAIVVAAAIVSNLQTIVSRELDKENSAIISIGTLSAGSAKNIVAEDAWMSGTCRFYGNDLLDTLRDSITRIAQNTAEAFRASAEVSVELGCPAVINDPDLSRLAAESVAAQWGQEALVHFPKSSLNEDFSVYAKAAPTLYAFVGACDPEKQTVFPLHSPQYDIDEESLSLAAGLYVRFALDFLA